MKQARSVRLSTVKKRSRDPAAKREVILKAALKEFARHGFGGARADRVALAAGVSVGTIFKLFKDKRGLANEVFAECLRKIADLIVPPVTRDLSAREAFDEMWKGYTTLLFQDPETLIFFEYQPNSDFLDPHNKVGLFELRNGLNAWTEKHQAARVLKQASTESLRAIAIGSIMRVLREFIDGHTTLTPAGLDELNELVWQAIAR